MDYTNVFVFGLAIKLSENTSLNKHAIKLVDGKKLPYESIYSLEPVELETLNTYIKIYLKTRFIYSSKSPKSISILFNEKSNGSFCRYINY